MLAGDRMQLLYTKPDYPATLGPILRLHWYRQEVPGGCYG
jgi:hypothetical protein